MMITIGITGGVGAGKSTVLDFLEEKYQAYVMKADEIGHLVMEPGQSCYEPVIALFGRQIIKNDKTIDRRQVSDVVFSHPELLEKLNQIIHPAVKQPCMEEFLGIKDRIYDNGKECIKLYKDFLKKRDAFTADEILGHNLEDVLGLGRIFDMLGYLCIYDGDYEVDTETEAPLHTATGIFQWKHRLLSDRKRRRNQFNYQNN